MSAIMKIRQARSPDQIADALEPLALSLAALADQAQESIQSLEAVSQQQGAEWSEHQRRAADSLKDAAEQIETQSRGMKRAATWMYEAQERMWRRITVTALLAALLGAGLSTASVLWLIPPPTPSVTLDPQLTAEWLKPHIEDALKKRK